MGCVTHTVCVLLCFWVSGSSTLQTVGPCTVNRETAAFDCSGKRLTSVPKHIWMNVTYLDLSDNLLDLTRIDSFKRLNRFSNLVTLNLSGNYFPLLLKEHLYRLTSLKVLDLSRCKLAAVEADALSSLSNQFVQIRGEPNRHEVGKLKSLLNIDEHSEDTDRGAFLRKLLAVETNATNNGTKAVIKDQKPENSSSSWKVLVAVLVSAITLSVFIAVMAKCKVVHRYLASYRHSRLSEVDATSQCDPGNFEVGFATHGGPGTRAVAPDIEEDDDGFIEDNYIQASESERATRETTLTDDDDDDEEEEEIEFSIG
ncbi:type III endosome membrane protein TEMP isoform X1 [Danio rerio]|uniref:Si:ch73-185c24.2 n=2 Tax=Danio rerio TaxID=7955 RepID=X1WDW0_DANRE|nr:type III endosome membrane protein TEMP precursor [Danio rerio]|eukprot:NP_001313511.1 type III endosome membrane protein TEMP precursor [Danio rerio]